MRGWTLLLLLLAVTGTMAKKARSDAYKKHMAAIEEKLLELEEEVERELAEELAEEDEDIGDEDEGIDEEDEEIDEEDEEDEEDDASYDAPEEYEEPKDPCGDVYCGAGRVCAIAEDGTGSCMCVDKCEPETDDRRRVCSNHNETWDSDCEMYRQRCLCEEGLKECKKEEYKHVHIDYYGECQELPDCDESELEDFPRRMNEWLFNIMRDMADRQMLTEHYLGLEQEAEDNPTKRWTNAVVWKWCELDSHPRDRAVSRHELFPIRAPLLTLEHCIGTFLDSCDPDDDHYVTLKEWAKCTKLSAAEIEQLEDMCEEIREQ